MLAATLAAHGVPYRDVGTLEAAVAAAWDAARAGAAPVVLLSPACASWDQFTGFDQRGDRFRALAQDRLRCTEEPPDARTVPRRQLAARPLVVDGRPLDAARRHRR